MNNFDRLGHHVSLIDNMVDRFISKIGINANHFDVIYTVASSEDGMCTQKKICQECYMPKQTVFNICKDLKNKGLIEFSESNADRRLKFIILTEKGKVIADKLLNVSDALFGRAFSIFGKKKTQVLFDLMDEFVSVCNKEIENIEINSQENLISGVSTDSES